jgi:DNA ligase-1
MSEKLDGARIYWNGHTIVSKNGNTISCPNWFIDELPKNITLDGELWMGRGNWELVMELLSSTVDNTLWKKVLFMIFDTPHSSEPYEIRMRDMANLQIPKYAQIVDIEKCRGNNHLFNQLGNILDMGGEGIMLNKPESLYVRIRTDTLLKAKVGCLFLLTHFNISYIMILKYNYWRSFRLDYIVYSE